MLGFFLSNSTSFLLYGFFLEVTSFYDKILEAENAKTGTARVLHGKKNTAVSFAASRKTG